MHLATHVREIPALLAPPHNRVHHAADQLPHRAFALARSRFSVEILAGHDVRRRLRQLFGTSTSSWRKIVTPFSLPISAERFSHSTASNGEFFHR